MSDWSRSSGYQPTRKGYYGWRLWRYWKKPPFIRIVVTQPPHNIKTGDIVRVSGVAIKEQTEEKK